MTRVHIPFTFKLVEMANTSYEGKSFNAPNKDTRGPVRNLQIISSQHIVQGTLGFLAEDKRLRISCTPRLSAMVHSVPTERDKVTFNWPTNLETTRASFWFTSRAHQSVILSPLLDHRGSFTF